MDRNTLDGVVPRYVESVRYEGFVELGGYSFTDTRNSALGKSETLPDFGFRLTSAVDWR